MLSRRRPHRLLSRRRSEGGLSRRRSEGGLSRRRSERGLSRRRSESGLSRRRSESGLSRWTGKGRLRTCAGSSLVEVRLDVHSRADDQAQKRDYSRQAGDKREEDRSTESTCTEDRLRLSTGLTVSDTPLNDDRRGESPPTHSDEGAHSARDSSDSGDDRPQEQVHGLTALERKEDISDLRFLPSLGFEIAVLVATPEADTDGGPADESDEDPVHRISHHDVPGVREVQLVVQAAARRAHCSRRWPHLRRCAWRWSHWWRCAWRWSHRWGSLLRGRITTRWRRITLRRYLTHIALLALHQKGRVSSYFHEQARMIRPNGGRCKEASRF